jgi:hypothetical protein
MRRLLRFTALGAWVLVLGSVVAACAATADGPPTADIVDTVPWEDAVDLPEELTYRLEQDGDFIGTTTLTVEEQDGRLLFTQHSADDEGNSDTAEVLVESDTLKPAGSVRTIIDEDQKRVARSAYEAVDTDDCDTGLVVRVEQQTFDPPDEDEPDTRESPLCVPENGYENDSSLFIWRAIKFEENYTVSYNTVIAARRNTQTVTLRVADRVDSHPAGDREAWLVEISGDGLNQRAWFSTDPAHVMLAYQNESFLFVLEDDSQ